MKKTFWFDETVRSTSALENLTNNYPKISQDLEVDTAIIGGGIAGLLCAYELQTRGKTVALIEANHVGAGESANSSAMVTFAHDPVYQKLLKKHGAAVAAEYLELNIEGLQKIRKICDETDCRVHDCSMIFFATTRKGAVILNREHQAYGLLHQKTQLIDETELPFKVTLALAIENQFCLNPVEFSLKLAKKLSQSGVQIFENTRVTEQPEGEKLRIGNFTVSAKNFVIATHFPFLNAPGFYFAKMYQSRSHNIIFNGKLSNMYESAEDNGFEFRPTEGGILCGGAAVRTGKYKHRSRFAVVKNHILETFGAESQIIAEFSAQDCMTFDMLPFVGRYSAFTGNLYVSTGFNKWGFTTAAAAGKLLADTMENSETENIFSPSRGYFFSSPEKKLKNIGSELLEFLNLPFSFDAKKFERIGKMQGAVVRHKGKRLGIFRDNEGKIHAIHAICPHLGCGLKWNKDELSWDCPCHGSRFDIEGNILGSPTIKNAENLNPQNRNGFN